jgi:hypothetical protein
MKQLSGRSTVRDPARAPEQITELASKQEKFSLVSRHAPLDEWIRLMLSRPGLGLFQCRKIQ